MSLVYNPFMFANICYNVEVRR